MDGFTQSEYCSDFCVYRTSLDSEGCPFLLSILTNAYGAVPIKHNALFRGAYAKCFCLDQKSKRKAGSKTKTGGKYEIKKKN
ncbi:hypothetical protein DWZ38_16390 [Ruminococcus sp. AF31-8BH]|nr:hypothetical protein DWZ38_16390 [Ruminococcus sp. AF31-8BH]